MSTKFSLNTDTVDIDAKCVGVSTFDYANRGLKIQIRHNREAVLFEAANRMAEIISQALNEAVKNGDLCMPEPTK